MLKNRKKVRSLKRRSVIMVLCAILVSALIFFLVWLTGELFVSKIYLTQDKSLLREKSYAQQFNEYVKTNGVKSNDYDQIKEWCNNKKYVDIILLEDNRKVFYTDGTYANISNEGASALRERTYKASFSDKTKTFSITEYTSSAIYSIVLIVGIVLSLSVMFIIVVSYMMRIVSRITLLTEKVKDVNNGESALIIPSDKNDELSLLGEYTEEMRRSIVTHYENECKALKANNDLITSISHDIRTPLTSIVGYSEIIADESNTDMEEIRKCASICREKAYQLKDMTDALFKYFLVYGSAEMEIKKDVYSADLFLQQLIGERKVFSQQLGLTIDTTQCENKLDNNIYVYTDQKLLRRVFDNVFSNINKYALTSEPVYVSLEYKDGYVELVFKNTVSKDKTLVESTKIGIKTSEKIMEALGGKSDFDKRDNYFEVRLNVPAIKND